MQLWFWLMKHYTKYFIFNLVQIKRIKGIISLRYVTVQCFK